MCTLDEIREIGISNENIVLTQKAINALPVITKQKELLKELALEAFVSGYLEAISND